jgi:ABC-type spermidine/putrescine transport system permease subunit II
VIGKRRRNSIFDTLLWIYAAAIYLFLYAPVVTVTVLSFNDSQVVGLPFRGFTLQWFVVVFTRPELISSLANSLLLGVVSGTIGTALATSLALAFRQPFPGKGLVFHLVIAPIVVPGIVAAVILFVFFGLLKIPLSLWTTVLIAHVTWVLPFSFLSLYPAVHRFDASLEEAAGDLGARRGVVFRRIVFPLIRTGVVSAWLFAFSLSFDEFIRTLFLTGYDRTLPVQFWYMIVESLSPEAPAMAVVIIVISVVTSLAGALIARRAA